MSHNKFELIKKNLKSSKSEDKKESDKAWRVRPIVEILKNNIMRFGIFCTALSIDEMMVKYYSRFTLKQFIKSKPIRFGIKMWALGSANGYVFNFDIYCGKNEETLKLSKCPLGSRVVISMLEPLLINTSPRKLAQYHVYFDNLFCCPDLLIHLKKAGLRSTGTVRDNRVSVKNVLDKNAPRETHLVQHEQNNGLNFITVQDSKAVLILSTAAGVIPLGSISRYDKIEKIKKGLPFPHAFTVYNQFMGGIDIHDQHCSRVLPIFRSKKWTLVILMRLIQATITNATVLWNSVKSEENRGTKDFALEISKYYLEKHSKAQHNFEKGLKRSYCSVNTCKIRTSKLYKTCKDTYYCEPCFKKAHLQ
ncbi:PREDICTED: piggyBac transposable element-derived protein 3-like [Dinoponera quadriceps]|uniref:PiggyBac transposable element-derived protein 3-like n=1 Tax=Dinoponera quadriceps TaxID=609295 RepID=A0A6P3Y9I4_DINQU|nr:PREDICTED: piggyBac transposable element-derived protein 3-like [Dinoponera quadriceps]